MDKSKCPDCGNPTETTITSVGVGYYCKSEDKFIGEYFEGPTREELDRNLKREEILIYVAAYSPLILLVGWFVYMVSKLL